MRSGQLLGIKSLTARREPARELLSVPGGVTNLGGYCRTTGHQVLAFAVFLDGPDNRRGIALLSRMVAAMVRY